MANEAGLSRRDILAAAGMAGAVGVLPGVLGMAAPDSAMATPPAGFVLPPLPYVLDALEPAIDKMTMEIHHGKHHKAYVDNANKALAGTPLAGMKEPSALEVFRRFGEIPVEKRMTVRNNVGGLLNHSQFWTWMAPAGTGGEPASVLAGEIGKTFGSMKGLQEKFAAAAMSRFGSGWAWLMVGETGALSVVSTANQDSPWMGAEISGVSGKPILGVDVWEHAYYLKYQNKRADYLSAWWSIVNWVEVNNLYARATADR